MYDYLKKLLNKQIQVVFFGSGTIRGKLISIDSIGVTLQDSNNNKLVMMPFSSGAFFTADEEDI